MSKVDALRALREAKYAAATTGSAQKASPRPAAKPTTAPTSKQLAEAIAAGEEIDAQLCGHQAIGGKRCIRPKDHPEKNHRYGKSTEPKA